MADVTGLQSIELEQATRQRWRRLLYAPILRVLEALLVRSADLVLTVNDRLGDLLRERSPRPCIRTLRDAADAELATIPAADRAALGVPEHAVAVAFVGSLVYSRLEPIFAAWRELCRESKPPLHLVVIGDGPDLRPYARRAADDGWLWRSVSFLGPLPHHEAIAAVAACDIGYSECWSDAGFPAKLFEYMALGKPIVVEGKPQLGEVLEDGRDACFFETPADLAAVLRRLARDPELRERLGRRAHETFLSAHTAAVRRREFSAFLGIPAPSQSTPPAEASRAPVPTRAMPKLTTVVIPVLNGADSLRRQLEAVKAQDYDGAWEVVVVDNGSDDGSVEIARAWTDEQRNARLVRAPDVRGAAHARNRGVAAAEGDFIAFCDADDVVTPRWLTELTRAATRADLVGGSLSARALNAAEVRSWREEPSQLALLVAHGFLRFASGGNFGIWTEVFDRLGGLDERLAAGEDIDLSWRAQLAGYRLGFAPRARDRGRASARPALARAPAVPLRSLCRTALPALQGGWDGTPEPCARRHDVDLAVGDLGARPRHERRKGPVGGDRRQSLGPPGGQHPVPSGGPLTARRPHLVEVGLRWPPETFLRRKLEGLAAAGMAVTVASRGGPRRRRERLARRAPRTAPGRGGQPADHRRRDSSGPACGCSSAGQANCWRSCGHCGRGATAATAGAAVADAMLVFSRPPGRPPLRVGVGRGQVPAAARGLRVPRRT